MPASVMTMDTSARPDFDPHRERDDAALLREAGGGDQRAFAALVERHHDLLRRVARAVLPDDPPLAEDAVQDALLSAFRAADRWDGRGSVRAWLAVIALNAARDRLRSLGVRRQRERPLDGIADALAAPVHVEPALPPEAVWACVERLPEDERDVVVLRYRGGLGASEIATRLGLTRFGVHKRLRRALESLRSTLRLRHAALMALLGLPLTGEAAPPPAPRVASGAIGAGALAVVVIALSALVLHPGQPPVSAAAVAATVEPPPVPPAQPAGDPAQRAWELVPSSATALVAIRVTDSNRHAMATAGFPFLPKALLAATSQVVLAAIPSSLVGVPDSEGDLRAIFLLEGDVDAAWAAISAEVAATAEPARVQRSRSPAGDGWRMVCAGNVQVIGGIRPGQGLGWSIGYRPTPAPEGKQPLFIVRARPDAVVLVGADPADPEAPAPLSAVAEAQRSPAIALLEGIPPTAWLRVAASSSPDLRQVIPAQSLEELTGAIGPTTHLRFSGRFATPTGADGCKGMLAGLLEMAKARIDEIPEAELGAVVLDEAGLPDQRGDPEAVRGYFHALADSAVIGGTGDGVTIELGLKDADTDALLIPVGRQ